MKNILKFIFLFLLFAWAAGAHAVDKGPVLKTDGNYTIEFFTFPKFPVIGKRIWIGLKVADLSGQPVLGADARAEAHGSGAPVILNLEEEGGGLYGAKFKFLEAGEYEVHIILNGKELKSDFILEVDEFGLSGLARAGAVLFLLLLLISLMVKDCRRK